MKFDWVGARVGGNEHTHFNDGRHWKTDWQNLFDGALFTLEWQHGPIVRGHAQVILDWSNYILVMQNSSGEIACTNPTTGNFKNNTRYCNQNDSRKHVVDFDSGTFAGISWDFYGFPSSLHVTNNF